MDHKKSPKLEPTEIRDQIVEAGLNAIPYVGSPLSTLYFGVKNAKRFKRLESFYADLTVELSEMRDSVDQFKQARLDEDAALLTEQINSHVESEPSSQKQAYFRRFFRSNLLNPLLLSYEERKLLLESLAALSVLDISLLAFLYDKPDATPIKGIRRGTDDTYQILASISRLKFYGYVATYTLSIAITMNTDNALNESVGITEYGKRFFAYVLDPST